MTAREGHFPPDQHGLEDLLGGEVGVEAGGSGGKPVVTSEDLGDGQLFVGLAEPTARLVRRVRRRLGS